MVIGEKRIAENADWMRPLTPILQYIVTVIAVHWPVVSRSCYRGISITCSFTPSALDCMLLMFRLAAGRLG